MFLGSCKKTDKIQRISNAPILAEVGQTKLFQDELEELGLFTNAKSTADSTQIINAYVQKWIKDQLMLSEAEKSLSEDIDIDMLVQDYRESLLLYNYENAMVRDQLDTAITRSQIETYYQEHVEAFNLSESIIRCEVAILDRSVPRLDRFYANWKTNKTESINDYLKEHGSIQYMDGEKWYSEDDLFHLLRGAVSKKDLKSKKIIQEAKDGSEYFVKILEYIDKSEDPPLAYVSSNIKKIILHQRKSKLIKNLKEDLYQREINSSKVRIHQ